MELDYTKIGMRIARRRRALGLKQAQVEERAGLGYKYLSNIERGISIPSVEVIMRLAAALDTTPDAFLVGTERREDLAWQDVAQLLRLGLYFGYKGLRAFLTVKGAHDRARKRKAV